MSLRTEIQNRITGCLKDTPFPVIGYDTSTFLASETGEEIIPSSVAVNESNGTATPSRNRTSNLMDISDWMFEGYLHFSKEVDINGLFFNKFDLNFISKEGILVTIKSDSFYVQHPTRKGTPTGTECRLVFKVTTRR